MKVAVVTQFPRDLSRPHGGVEAVSATLVEALKKHPDLDIHVVTFDPVISEKETISLAGITVHRLPTPKGSVLLTSVTTGRRIIQDYLANLKPDLVHANDTYGLTVKGIEIPRVFTIHGFIYKDTLVSGAKMPMLRSLLWRWIETSGWADQPHIISISPYVRERIAGIARGVIHDIENPVSNSFFEIDRVEKPGLIFSAAVISRRKNTLALVDAVRILTAKGYNPRLRIAGKIIDREYGSIVQKHIKSSGLEKNIILLNSIGSEQVRAELAQANIFALVSLEENAPLGIEEAMAAGVPVVASNRCGMPYMVGHGETGFLVNPIDPENIAERFRVLLDDDKLRKTMGQRSRLIAKDRFHPERVAFKTREVYYEAV